MPTILAKLFEIEQADDTIVLVPKADLGEVVIEQIEAEAIEVLKMLEQTSSKNLVIDFEKTDYFGSAALVLFIKFGSWVRQRAGHLAFCNLSENEKEILQITKLDSLWHICSSKSEAMESLRK